MKEIIRIKDLNFQYKNKVIFSKFNLTIKEGSFVVIAGANQSGKTTLLKLIAGILPSNDSITLGYSYVDDRRMTDNTLNIGVMLSSIETVFLFDTVYQELSFPLTNLKFTKLEINNRIQEVCEFFEIKDLLECRIEELTVAQRKKISLVLALLHNPKVVLLDNPFTMLSKKEAVFFRNQLKAWNKKENTTIVLFSTTLEDTLLADYVYVLQQGHIKIEGTPMTVMQEESLLRRLGLELPFMVDLSQKLKFYNLIEEEIIEMNRMVDKLWK